MDPDFPEIPTDYEAGTDFPIMKPQKASMLTIAQVIGPLGSVLTQEERDAINTNGLFNLMTLT